MFARGPARCLQLAVFSFFAVPPLAAQGPVDANAAAITLGGRLQPQYSASSVAEADNDSFLRRMRLRVDIRVNDFLSGRAMPEFAGPDPGLQDAFVRLDWSESFTLWAGQMKRAFDIFDLASSVDLPIIERDGAIEGLSACAGIGSICSYGRFTRALGFAGRDQGVRLRLRSGRATVLATLTNGTGVNVPDENDAKSGSAWVRYRISDGLRLSGQFGAHDYLGPSKSAAAIAWGGDVEFGTWRDGLHVLAAVVRGDNWRLLDAADEPAKFLALQALVSHYWRLERPRFEGIEPLARVSFGDPDRAVGDNGGLLVTPGVMLYMEGRNGIALNLDVYAPEAGETEVSLKAQMFLYF